VSQQVEIELDEAERSMLAGELGEAARWGIQFQMSVGAFFGARRLLPIRSAHLMCDAEAIGTWGVEFLEQWATLGAKVVVPTTSDPRSVDFAYAQALQQDDALVAAEQRIISALGDLGVIPCNTCINYQIVDSPHFGETLGWGDTGSAIYANSVIGARTNFEGGPAALAAAFSGRVAEYGFHLDEQRRGTIHVRVEASLRDSADWGALGCLVGRAFPGYWVVPVFEGDGLQPSPDEFKQLGASLASYGSHAMFHLVGVTPEASTREDAFGGREPQASFAVSRADLDGVFSSFPTKGVIPDVVVIGTPQLSLFELQNLSKLFGGREARLPVLATTTPDVKAAADRYGYSERLAESGVSVLQGVCFYLMAARELGLRNGYESILTNSAKLANIIEGSGYQPIFRSTEDCVEAAVEGKIPESS